MDTNISEGYCQCGCGQTTPAAKRTNPNRGLVKGKPTFYLPGHHKRKSGVDYIEEDRGFETPCWIWQRRQHRKGYGTLDANGPLAHRVYYEAANGPLPSRLNLHHRCEVKLCVNPAHLSPVSPMEHRRLHKWYGEHVHMAKLCEDDVRQMRRLRQQGWTYKAIADKFGITRQCASMAIRGKTWRYI